MNKKSALKPVTVEEGAEVIDSILMPGAAVGKDAKVYKSVIGDGAFVGASTEIGAEDGIGAFLDRKICSKDISLIGPGVCIDEKLKIKKNSHISEELLSEEYSHAASHREVVNVELVYA